MAIAFRSSATNFASTPVTSIAVTKPAGVVTGDLLVAFVRNNGGPTAPSGWTKVRETTDLVSWQKVAGSSEPSSYTFGSSGGGNFMTALVLAYSDVPGVGASAGTAGTSTSPARAYPAPSVTANSNDVLICGWTILHATAARVGITPPAGMVERADALGWSHALAAADETLYSSGATGTRTASADSGSGNRDAAAHSIILSSNRPPNAPILDVPSSVNRSTTNRFNLTPSDPNPGDSTSRTDWRYRVIGAPSWTVVSKSSPDTFYDFPSGTFAAGDYEVQARTYDRLGEVGPYSSSSFFTAADVPNQPTWVDPINGQTISTDAYTGTISAPDVDESEWRLVADSAGVINEASVLHGPVLKTTGDKRSHTFTGLTNGVTVWWQARTKFTGLWSGWAAVRTPVAYTAPPTPTLVVAAADSEGAATVTVTNPAPGAGVPAVSYNDIYVRAVDGDDPYRPAEGVRIVTEKPPNSTHIDRGVASGVNYEYQAVAVGVNGTAAVSAWVPLDESAEPTIYYGAGYGDG